MITEQNLHLLIDLLVQEGKRVVGPKQAGTMVLYEPLQGGPSSSSAACRAAPPRRHSFPS